MQHLINKVLQGDCLELMKQLPDKSIDMICCDLPYGVTSCRWDVVIPFESLWEQYKRIVKPNAAIVLFGVEPFSSKLRLSNLDWYKYDWVWKKSQSVGHLNAWRQPVRNTENISVFYLSQPSYNPILTDKIPKNIRPHTRRTKMSENYGVHNLDAHRCPKEKSMPSTILEFNNAQNTVHPTQKPTSLLEYLIKTYTNNGDLVLDNCAGSGTTAIAALNTGRNYILMEKETEYIEVINNRIANHTVQLQLAV